MIFEHNMLRRAKKFTKLGVLSPNDVWKSMWNYVLRTIVWSCGVNRGSRVVVIWRMVLCWWFMVWWRRGVDDWEWTYDGGEGCDVHSSITVSQHRSLTPHGASSSIDVPSPHRLLTTNVATWSTMGLEGPFDQKGKGHRPPHPTGHLMANQLRGRHLQPLPTTNSAKRPAHSPWHPNEISVNHITTFQTQLTNALEHT